MYIRKLCQYTDWYIQIYYRAYRWIHFIRTILETRYCEKIADIFDRFKLCDWCVLTYIKVCSVKKKYITVEIAKKIPFLYWGGKWGVGGGQSHLTGLGAFAPPCPPPPPWNVPPLSGLLIRDGFTWRCERALRVRKITCCWMVRCMASSLHYVTRDDLVAHFMPKPHNFPVCSFKRCSHEHIFLNTSYLTMTLFKTC